MSNFTSIFKMLTERILVRILSTPVGTVNHLWFNDIDISQITTVVFETLQHVHRTFHLSYVRTIEHFSISTNVIHINNIDVLEVTVEKATPKYWSMPLLNKRSNMLTEELSKTTTQYFNDPYALKVIDAYDNDETVVFRITYTKWVS